MNLVAEESETSSEEMLRRRRVRKGRFDLRPDQVGATVHEVLAELFVSEVDLYDVLAVHEYVRTRILSYSISHTQSRRLRVATSVAKYFSHFRRGPGWSFLGAEVNVDDVRLDLLWLTPDGDVEADEIKTGLGAVFGKERHLREQLTGQVRAGQEVFGAHFRGVRAVLLARPEESFLATEKTHGARPNAD